MQCKNIRAAVLVNEFLICLKFARLNLTELDTFLMCFLNESVESRMTPRYLNSFTSESSSPPRNTPDQVIFGGCFAKYIQTLFLTFKERPDLVSQSWTLPIAIVCYSMFQCCVVEFGEP